MRDLAVVVRPPESIYHASGPIQDGTFDGRWHFSFDRYRDPAHVQFGNLRVLNDDTFSPGATWPLHPHRQNEVVTYVAEGEFRHEDERGKGGVLHQGGVQHTTVGSGMFHAEINPRPDIPLRFVQIWFIPEQRDLAPSVEQREVARGERTNRWLPLASPHHSGALPLRADGAVFASYLEAGATVEHPVEAGRGLYCYLLNGGPVTVGEQRLPTLAAAEVRGEGAVAVEAERPSELLLLDVNLHKDWP
ncbi:MAG: pirin family protein [Thermoplasmata archaeon]|nr:pirin family protein [Thermoplasmata archaeon]